MPPLAIVPPVADHCSTAAAPELSTPRDVMTMTLRFAACNGTSEMRLGVIWILSTRAITGELEMLQPRASVPTITAPRSLDVEVMANAPPGKTQRPPADCWRPGEHGGQPAVAPWLCVTVFRRFCSEQQRQTWRMRWDCGVSDVTPVREMV